MRSEFIPYENTVIGEMWTQAHRITDVDVDPGEERTVVGLNCSPALVYQPATTDRPEELAIYHGHIRLAMSPEEWEWLVKKMNETLTMGRQHTKDLEPGSVHRLK